MEVVLRGTEPQPSRFAYDIFEVRMAGWLGGLPDAVVIEAFWREHHQLDVPQARELFRLALAFGPRLAGVRNE